MPLTLNIGLTKKMGLPDYGSLGASCHVQVELDGSLLQSDLDGFHRHVRNAFRACRQAVHDELARQNQMDPPASNGHASRRTNSSRRSAAQRPELDRMRPASASQVRAIEAIGQRRQLDLANLLSERFQVAAADELSIL